MFDMIDLNNKVVIITGASKGIGRETAVFFAREGASLVLAARGRDALKASFENLGNNPQKQQNRYTCE
jgi:NADP-dependent 3-hydroxy acid dehydrogenase YdfG